jgi:hypothetical protein
MPGFHFRGQDGYFRAAIHACMKVVEKPLPYLWRHGRNVGRLFDWVVVNYKAAPHGKRFSYDEIKDIRQVRGCGKVLFINSARASNVPGDDILDLFDVVFKREMLRDPDKYRISSRNKVKLRTTMLCCPLIPANRLNVNRLKISRYGSSEPSRAPEFDVSFLGVATNSLRVSCVDALLRVGDIRFAGGVIPRGSGYVEIAAARARRLSRSDYIKQIRNSAVGLAIDGLGEFTYRHLELWCLSSFMLCSPSIRGLDLPLGAVENVHYVCFENPDDLVDKVVYYRDNASARETVARSGREMFVRDYNFRSHGDYIRRSLGL